MADSKSGGMAQAQKEKIDNKLLKINEQWINDVKARVEEGKIPNDVGDNLINKINTNIWRIKSGKAPIIDNIEFLKGNTEEGESEIKIKITFNKATQKTQMEELKKIIEDLNVSRDAQQMGTITYDEKNNTIELFRIPPLQKIEVELEVAKQEVPISTSTVPVEEIQKSTEAIKTTMNEIEKTVKEIEQSGPTTKQSTFLTSLKNLLSDVKNAIVYKLTESESNKIQEERQRYIQSFTKLIKQNQMLKSELEKEKGENKEKIEQLMSQQQQLVEQINNLKEMFKQKPEEKKKTEQKKKLEEKPKPGEQEKKSTGPLSGQSVSGATKSTSSKIYSLSFSDPNVKKKFENYIKSTYNNELTQFLDPQWLANNWSFDKEDSELAKMLGFNDKTPIGSKYKYSLPYQKINVDIEIEWKGDNNFVITLIK